MTPTTRTAHWTAVEDAARVKAATIAAELENARNVGLDGAIRDAIIRLNAARSWHENAINELARANAAAKYEGR
jgi:hypothetical protein